MQPISGFARLWAAVAAVLALFLAITLGLVFTGATGAAPAAGQDAEAVSETGSFEVLLTDFAIEPAELVVPTGVPLALEVRNEGSLPHDYVIDGVAKTAVLAAGESETLHVDPLDAGTYDTRCAEVGHDAAGMTGRLVAQDGAGDVEASAATDHDMDGMDHMGATDPGALTAEELAAKHDDFEFPTATEGEGNQPLEPTVLDDGTKRFELTAAHISWETEPGTVLDAMAYNGQVPGPRIDVEVGDRVQIELTNELEAPTALHLHGLVLPNDMDGVPGVTQKSILPGESFTYELEIREDNSGSHMYHSHFDSANQVPSGLLGAFIVHGPDEPDVDHDVVMILNDGPLGYTLNGKGFPATQPLAVEQGDTVRIRYMNEGLLIHPMHLHGMPQRVIERDGYPLEAPYVEDNVLVSPGDRVDVLVEATEPGVWAWHCHILSHAEGPDGMFGMVTALVVEE